LRLSQYWVMYGTLGRRSAVTQLIGTTHHFRQPLDLYRFIKTRGREQVTPAPNYVVPHNMTDLYPSSRWERAISRWAKGEDRTGRKAQHFCRALCVLLNQDIKDDHDKINSVALVYTGLRALPPGSKYRYAEEEHPQSIRPDFIHEINCQDPDNPVPTMSAQMAFEPQIIPNDDDDDDEPQQDEADLI